MRKFMILSEIFANAVKMHNNELIIINREMEDVHEIQNQTSSVFDAHGTALQHSGILRR